MAISEQVEEMGREDLEDLAVNLYENLENRLTEIEDIARDAHDTATNNQDRLDDVEKTASFAQSTAFELEDAVGGDRPSATTQEIANTEGSLIDRVDALERGEVSVSDIVDAGAAGSDLQIQRWRADVKESDDPQDVSGLTANQARSTLLWAEFHDRAERSHGKLKLDRAAATSIYRADDHDYPTDRNTVNRCMRFMARATGPTDDAENDDHLVTFVPGDQGSRSVLVADQEEYEQVVAEAAGVDAPDRDRDVDLYANPDARTDTTADDATDMVDEDVEKIMAASAVTSSSEDDVEDEHGMEVSHR